MEATSFRHCSSNLGHQVEEGTAVAVNGEIFQDVYQTDSTPEAEIWPIPKIGGG